MEQPKVEIEKQAEEQRSFLANVPKEIKTYIISFLVSAKEVYEAIRNIKALSLTSKCFHNVINDPQVLDTLIKEISNQFPRMDLGFIAIIFNNPQWLKDHIQHNPEKKWSVGNFLLSTATRGDTTLTQFSLNAGADVNQSDNDGKTPLHEAAVNGHIEIVKLLLDAGADVNAQDKHGNTPLCWSIKEIVGLLLDAKADPNKEDIYGQVPLHFAATNGYKDTAELLLNAGADVNKANTFGSTPLSLATLLDRQAVVELLHKFGAER
jgi:ankyrin repeat protein